MLIHWPLYPLFNQPQFIAITFTYVTIKKEDRNYLDMSNAVMHQNVAVPLILPRVVGSGIVISFSILLGTIVLLPFTFLL